MPILRTVWLLTSILLACTCLASLQAEAQDPRLVAIVGLIRDGKPAEAVSRADAVIAGFAAAQHEPGVSYFCNRDRGGLANLMAGVRGGRKVDLAPEAWCEALFAKGFALTDLHRFDEAAAALEQAVAMDPSNPHFLNQYGDILRYRGEPKEAIVRYQAALDLVRDEPADTKAAMGGRAWQGIGEARLALGDLAGARDAYAASLDLEAENADARAKLADIARRLAEPAQP